MKEKNLQISCFQYLQFYTNKNLNEKEKEILKKWSFHIPNGGSRHILEARSLKLQGVKAGIPDIFVPLPRGVWGGLFIELKIKNNKLTENQKRFKEDLSNFYKIEICKNLEEFKKILDNYFI